MKNNEILRVFLGGDVFGVSGLRCVAALLPGFLSREEIDFCAMNGENATQGIGLSRDDAKALFAAGVDVITGGNHSFEKRDLWPALEELPAVLRPANFPRLEGQFALPGRGSIVVEKAGARIAVLNLQGREDMTAIDCPFRAADSSLAEWAKETVPPIVLVDFHAESNQEKEALGLYLDGRVSAVVGTHTHVQTADERILAKGTAYMTDLGMTGPASSVIGGDPAISIRRNVSQVLYRLEEASGPSALRGLVVDVSAKTGRALSVRRVDIPEGK